MSITPEIEAKWRSEFLVWLKEKHSISAEFIDDNLSIGIRQGRSVRLVVGVAWQAWKDSRSTVIIQPSETIIHRNGRLYTEILHIESQGYRVRSEA